MMIKWVWRAFLDSLPIGAAYFPLGLVWGILWHQAGLAPLWGIAFSATVFAGAVQFIALAMIVSGASIAAILIATIPIALRNCFYTTAAMPRLPTPFFQRIYSAFSLVDANFAIIMTQPHEVAANRFYHISLALFTQLYWVLGTAIGVFNLCHLPDGMRTLDFALPALLLTIVIGQVKKIGSLSPVLIALAAGGICHFAFGAHYLIPALIICTVAALASNPKEAKA